MKDDTDHSAVAEPAFPTQRWVGSESPTQRNPVFDPGMTLRDYFAAKVLHALIVEPPWGGNTTATVHVWSEEFTGSSGLDRFAFSAYRMADAMLKARSA